MSLYSLNNFEMKFCVAGTVGSLFGQAEDENRRKNLGERCLS